MYIVSICTQAHVHTYVHMYTAVDVESECFIIIIVHACQPHFQYIQRGIVIKTCIAFLDSFQ